MLKSIMCFIATFCLCIVPLGAAGLEGKVTIMTENILLLILVESEIELWTSHDPRKHMQLKWWKSKNYKGFKGSN